MPLRHFIGAEAEALHHAGAKALDQRVGARQHLPCERAPRFAFQVERNGAFAAVERHARVARARVGEAVDHDDIGAQVGEQHAREGRGADARELDDAKALQRAGGGRMSTFHADFSRGSRGSGDSGGHKAGQPGTKPS